MMLSWLFIATLGSLVICGSDGMGFHAFPRARSVSSGDGIHHVWQTKQFKQHVDHFGFAQNKTFQQRYLVSEKTYKKGGPIFFYTGSEGDIEEFANETGFMWDIAADFQALIVFAEHRYYGSSIPKGKGLRSYQYLSTEQALADYASLGRHLKKQYSAKKLISFGGGYGGIQSAWFRMKYPHVADGAIASSAPIFQGETDCKLMPALATKVYENASSVCASGIRRMLNRLPTIIQNMGGDKFGHQMKLCDNTFAVQFIMWIETVLLHMTFVNYPYAADIYEHLPAWPVKAACNFFTDKDATDDQIVTSMQKLSQFYQNSGKKGACINATSFMDVHHFKSTFQTWNYQLCTELIWPVCRNPKTDFFIPQNWNEGSYIQGCSGMFHIFPKKHMAAREYGSRQTLSSFSGHSNIVFSNGMIDPWSVGGVKKSTNPSVVVINIEDGAHCFDLRHSNPADTPSVIAARKKERSLIASWIKAK